MLFFAAAAKHLQQSFVLHEATAVLSRTADPCDVALPTVCVIYSRRRMRRYFDVCSIDRKETVTAALRFLNILETCLTGAIRHDRRPCCLASYDIWNDWTSFDLTSYDFHYSVSR